MLTIIMYHYVRDLPETRYPEIKGLLTEKFDGQLDYITKHYTVCSTRQVIAASRGETDLPKNACLLTFDDGFIDCYHTVFPRLEERKLAGSFYVPARAIEEHRVLDVHKIHFILAAVSDKRQLVDEIMAQLRKYRADYDLPTDQALYEKYATRSRHDGPDVVFIKKVLQRGLPENVRSGIVDRLFALYVSRDEGAFAAELYMDLSQLRCMQRHGMEIGGHGYRHVWLDSLSQSGQEEEISRTLDFLTKVSGSKPSDWVMCYPYGSYNDVTIELLEKAGCALGLTTRVGLAELSKPMEMSRLDTNDLPFSIDSDLSQWTMMSRES